MADRHATNARKKRPGRKRRVAGWLLLVIGVLITGVWGVSGWWRCQASRGPLTVTLSAGTVETTYALDSFAGTDLEFRGALQDAYVVHARAWNPPEEFYSYSMNWDLGVACAGDFIRTNRIPYKRCWFLVLWPFPLPLWTVGGLLLWWARWSRIRAMRGLCLKCGYDLAGLDAGAPCPECGGGRPLPTV